MHGLLFFLCVCGVPLCAFMAGIETDVTMRAAYQALAAFSAIAVVRG